MGVTFRGPVDPVMEGIAGAIRTYTDAHPAAVADIYRYSNVSVRVRVVDPDFCGKSRSERHRIVWPLLYALDGEILADLAILLLLTPDEKASSIGNIDFENPITFDEEYAAFQASRSGRPATP